jgi:hypothetical protein
VCVCVCVCVYVCVCARARVCVYAGARLRPLEEVRQPMGPQLSRRRPREGGQVNPGLLCGGGNSSSSGGGSSGSSGRDWLADGGRVDHELEEGAADGLGAVADSGRRGRGEGAGGDEQPASGAGLRGAMMVSGYCCGRGRGAPVSPWRVWWRGRRSALAVVRRDSRPFAEFNCLDRWISMHLLSVCVRVIKIVDARYERAERPLQIEGRKQS